MPITAVFIYLLVAIIYFWVAVKRVSKEERLVFFKAGKPESLAGPGLVLALPGIQQTVRLKISSHRTALPEVRFDNGPLLVKGLLTWKIVDPLKCASLPSVNARIDEELDAIFNNIVLNATIHDCLCDSFTVENVAEDFANEQTKSFGVRISKLECQEFPAHRLLAAQIAGLMGGIIANLEMLVSEAAEQPTDQCAQS